MLRSTLLKFSENKGFANWVTSNGTTRRMARRFVAGETLEEAIAAARECNNAGMLASLDYLGENVATTSDAQHSRDAYLEIFERIAQKGLNCNVSGNTHTRCAAVGTTGRPLSTIILMVSAL
jgi:proline dehydrogenase